MTAYEELKAWCEKHLAPADYNIVPESRSYDTTIYFTDDGIGYICFDRDGDVCGMGARDNVDMFEHMNEVGRKEKAELPHYSPPPTSIGGMMVRKMIEAYERNQK